MIIQGDCLEKLKELSDNSIDSIVTDPPYGISFMNRKWDYDVPSIDVWRECYRVLKPGGHMLVACGTRTQHRMVVGIEDGGFEIRDVISWIYGTGFPKSLNIGKTIEEKFTKKEKEFTTEWNGWGTALKPGTELWTLARKPLSEKTVVDNILLHRAGGINIEACRLNMTEEEKYELKQKGLLDTGRFPTNVLVDQETADVINEQGGDSRFFYVAKPSRAERDAGLEHFKDQEKAGEYCIAYHNGEKRIEKALKVKNVHPTVKPLRLMKYLCKLITPNDGVILDPYVGSGSTGIGAILEGFKFIGIERDPEYVEIAKARINYWGNKKDIVDIDEIYVEKTPLDVL